MMALKDKLNSTSNFNVDYFLGDYKHLIGNVDAHVREFNIPKSSGGYRKIVAPDDKLMAVQRNILDTVLVKYSEHKCANGFVRGKGIVTNSTPHIGAKSMGCIDIKDFFDSVTVSHMQNCLFGNKNICKVCRYKKRMELGLCDPSLYRNSEHEYEFVCEELKAVHVDDYCQATGYVSMFKNIIELCTYKGSAAQGFPTSPKMANIVMRGFDKAMFEYCNENGITYTRYADDMSFSSKVLDKYELKLKTYEKARKLLWAYGFRVNAKKVRYHNRSWRLKVCGVVVNEKNNIQRSDMDLFRAKVHHATVKNAGSTDQKTINQLKGYCSFVMSVNRQKGEKYLEQLTRYEQQYLATAQA